MQLKNYSIPFRLVFSRDKQ